MAKAHPARLVVAALTSPDLWLISIMGVAVNVGWVFLVTWLPRFLIARHGAELEAQVKAGLALQPNPQLAKQGQTLLEQIAQRQTGKGGAGAVAHTHSTWSTLLSDRHAAEGGLAIEGYEMLKGLAGVTTHAHREWLPIVENSQNWGRETAAVERKLRSSPGVHAFLIRRHGLYTWGRDVAETSRHLEILEFLLEAVARSEGSGRWQA